MDSPGKIEMDRQLALERESAFQNWDAIYCNSCGVMCGAAQVAPDWLTLCVECFKSLGGDVGKIDWLPKADAR